MVGMLKVQAAQDRGFNAPYCYGSSSTMLLPVTWNQGFRTEMVGVLGIPGIVSCKNSIYLPQMKGKLWIC